MKQIVLFYLILCWPAALAFGQVVNPPVIYQDSDIALHNTDVYYCPFAPPDSTCARMQLSCLGSMDSDGITHDYYPRIHGGKLSDWNPCGIAIGNAVPWQRLFTAMDKPSGAHSDIIAGGNPGDRVIISKNEDVDFRATGIIKLKSGFHVKPGAFFHAYTAPKFDTTVFSDEFSDNATFRNQWIVGDNTPGFDLGADCLYDTNLALVPDSDAHDGWALRLDLKEDSCNCIDKSIPGSLCTLDTVIGKLPVTYHFSTAMIHSCPWPFDGQSDTIKPAYHNAPYGKWEVREKIPIIEHHTNNYGDGQGNEWNLNERTGGGLTQIHPGLTHRFLYGPLKGRFGKRTTGGHDTAIFYSSTAHFTKWNNPNVIVINNFPYQVNINTASYPADTVLYADATTLQEGGFPSSLVADSTDSVTFYYTKVAGNNVSDPLAWSVDSATGTHFSFPYRDSAAYGIGKNGDTLYFNKGYQPTAIYLLNGSLPPPIKYHCHWDHRTGKILLTDTMRPTASHTGYGFSYDCNQGPAYPVPPINVDDTTYKYHTYSMELLPHEAEFLVDGAVRYRFPDRLVPIGDQSYDYVTTSPRAPMNIIPAEIGIDGSPSDYSDTNSTYYQEVKYFETNSATCLGCWTDAHGQHIASHRIDYVKVWDLPSDMKVPNFPH
jgi:hypothetical protein